MARVFAAPAVVGLSNVEAGLLENQPDWSVCMLLPNHQAGSMGGGLTIGNSIMSLDQYEPSFAISPPPNFARSPDFARPPRERLIEAASRLFCRYGINSVGVDAVVTEAGTAKATLYKTFGSKDALVAIVLEREGIAWRNWFLGGLDAGDAAPIDRLRRIFPLLAAWFAEERFYGCPFINAIGENDKHDDRLRSIALAHKLVVLGRIGEIAEEAGAEDPRRFAHQIGLLIDGAIVAAMVTRDPCVADLAAAMAETVFHDLERRAEAA